MSMHLEFNFQPLEACPLYRLSTSNRIPLSVGLKNCRLNSLCCQPRGVNVFFLLLLFFRLHRFFLLAEVQITLPTTPRMIFNHANIYTEMHIFCEYPLGSLYSRRMMLQIISFSQMPS